MPDLFSLENLIALLTLTSLEIVLGIDNIVFIAIITGRLDPAKRARVRRIGLSLAMILRILLLLLIQWIMKLTVPLFSLLHHEFSGRDLILLVGGLFLIAKATFEIHERQEGDHEHARPKRPASAKSALVQILALDLVFSLDSVITAVGMAQSVAVMIAAIVIAVGVMLIFAGGISRFIERHPTLKMLALAFLLLIGVFLLAEGLGKHLERGYVYFAMGFSLFVEFLNLRSGRHRSPLPAAERGPG